MASPPEVSVVIPVHNGAATIGACLEAVFASDFPDFEVVVADDASDDGTGDIVSSFPCRMVKNDACRGASAARNAGARAASGRILLFIDSDILIPSDGLRKVSAAMAKDGWDAVVGLLDKRAAYGNMASFYKNAYMHYTYSVLPPEMEVFYTSAAAIKRDVFFAVGGFDEDYRRASIEDTEVGGRIKAAGYRMRLEKGMTVKHLRHYCTGELLSTGFRRTSGIVKIILRRAFARTGESTYLTSPRSFTVGIALSLAAFAMALLSLFFGRILLLGGLAAVLASLLMNRGFLLFIFREKGLAAVTLSVPLLIIDQVAHGLGAFHGLATFVMGRRY